MRKKSNFNKKSQNKIIVATALILIFAVICVAVFPLLSNSKTKNYMYADGSVSYDFKLSDFDVSFGNMGKFLFNTKNSSFAVCSSNSTDVFYSHGENAAADGNAALFTVRVRDKKGNSYSMNSTSNSVKFNTFNVVEKTNDSVLVKYELFCNEEEAQKGKDEAILYTCIPMNLSYKNGKLTFSVKMSEVELSKGYFIEKISVLPGLFSVGKTDVGAKYIVPDGCGALIDVTATTESTLSLNLNMYGEDVSFYEYSQGANLPFFAMLTGNQSSLNAIIEEGDALSNVTCKKHKDGGGYMYNTFTVTPCGILDDKFVVGESYTGTISQTYVFDESEATYSSVSAQVRDSLIERNYISSTLNGNYTDLPFFINVIGSNSGDETFTTYEDAAEITALLKSRGVRSIALRFSGYGKDGLSKETYKPSKALGGQKGLDQLCAEISEQGNSIYFDTNILISSSSKDGVCIYDDESRFVGATPKLFDLSKCSDINQNISEIYGFVSGYDVAGSCINDASFLLYSDLDGKTDRQAVLNSLREGASALSTCGNLMLDYPAVYLSKNADAIFFTPNSVSCQEYSCVTAVPVLQMVLHGSVLYGSEAINVTGYSYEDAILKCIEYGCVPSFLFTHSGDTGITYSTYATQTSQLYQRAKQLLPVMNMQITSHEKVTDGVYKITYDYSRVFYVNYNPSVVEVNGIMISAKDFVVI